MSGSVGYLLDTNVILALIRANPLGEFIDRRFGLRAALFDHLHGTHLDRIRIDPNTKTTT